MTQQSPRRGWHVVDGSEVRSRDLAAEAVRCGIKPGTVRARLFVGDNTRAALFRPADKRVRAGNGTREVRAAIAAIDARKREMGAL